MDRLSFVLDINLLLSEPLASGSLVEFVLYKYIIAPTAIRPVMAVTINHDDCHKCAQPDNSTNHHTATPKISGFDPAGIESTRLCGCSERDTRIS